MYASLIGSGASQLYSLLQGQVQQGSSSFAVNSPSTSDSTSASASASSGTAGSSFDNAINQLFVDLQSASSSTTTSATSATASSASSTSPSSTEPTDTVANDLQNVYSDLQQSGVGGGHHHHHHDAGASASQTAQTDPNSAASEASSATSSTSNPFDNLASSLLAYVNTQGLTSAPTASTSLTA